MCRFYKGKLAHARVTLGVPDCKVTKVSAICGDVILASSTIPAREPPLPFCSCVKVFVVISKGVAALPDHFVLYAAVAKMVLRTAALLIAPLALFTVAWGQGKCIS